MLSYAFLAQIESLLNNEYVRREDFDLGQQKTRKENDIKNVQVDIVYRYDPSIHLSFSIELETIYNINYSPGDVLLDEHVSEVSSPKELIELIEEWIENIERELMVMPQIRLGRENAQRVSDIEESLKGYDDNLEFTKEEMDSLKQKLERLEKDLIQKIKDDEIKDEENEEKIVKLKNEFHLLRNQAQFLSKKNWMFSFITRTINWVKENPTLAAYIGMAAGSYLPEGVREHLPDSVKQILLLKEEVKK